MLFCCVCGGIALSACIWIKGQETSGDFFDCDNRVYTESRNLLGYGETDQWHVLVLENFVDVPGYSGNRSCRYRVDE